MDLSFSSAEEAFREEVRSWLEANLPAEWRHRGIGGYREDEEEGVQREWQRRLHDAGWLKLAWPKEAGGRAASPVMQAIYQRRWRAPCAPIILGRLGVTLLAPRCWCTARRGKRSSTSRRSSAASHLLSGLQRARRGQRSRGPSRQGREEEWQMDLNGQKTWSSGAHYADRSFLLARHLLRR